jgi:hypothetical protein
MPVMYNIFSGGRVWLQEAGFPFREGGKACSDYFRSSGMQHCSNPGPGVLLGRAT